MANRFWVGGTATWDGTAGTKWATTSGGAGGAAVPTAADDVFFDASSGAGTITTSGTTTDVCRSLNFTGFTGTLNHAASTVISIGDATAGASNIALKMVAGMGYTAAGRYDFFTTSATVQTIDSGGKSLSNVTINAPGGSLQLSSGLTISSSSTLNLTAGTFDTNGQTCSWGTFNSSNSNTRTLTMGASSITITGTGTAWTCSTNTNLTITSNTATITMTGSTVTFTPGSASAGTGSAVGNYQGATLVMTGSGTATVNGGSGSGTTLGGFTRTGTAARSDGVNIGGPLNVSTGTVTLTGNSSINRILVAGNSFGTASTITANVVSVTNVIFRDITAAGAASPFTGTLVGDGLGNSNITFDSPLTLYRVGAGGSWSGSNWSLSSGGATGQRVPLPQDTVFVDSGASGSITMDMSYLGGSIDFTGFTGTGNFGSTNNTVVGSMNLSSGMTVSGTQTLSFQPRSAFSITSNGQTFTQAVAISAPGGTLTLQDNLITAAGLSLNDGTFLSNNKNITAQTFTSNSSRSRNANWGSSTVTLTGSGGTLNISNWGGSQGTFTAGTSTWIFTDSTSAVKNITPGGANIHFWNVTLSGGGGAFVMNTGLGQTWNVDGTMTVNGPKTITFHASFTYIFGNLVINGSASNPVVFQSDSGGSTYNITNTTSTVQFWDVRDTIASTIIYAQASKDRGNNTNIVFTRLTANQQAYAGLRLPGSINNYASVPDSAALSITSDIDIRVRVIMDRWTPSATSFLLSKLPPGARSYALFVGTTGLLQMQLSQDGTNATAASSSVAPIVSDGHRLWVRATWRASDGRVQFFTAPGEWTNPTAAMYTQLGTNQTIALASIANTNAQMDIGAHAGGSSSPLKGNILRTQIYNGIDGTLAFDADFTVQSVGATSFTESSVNAATVTLQGTANLQPRRLIGNAAGGLRLPKVTGQTVSAPDSAALDLIDDMTFDVKVALDDWSVQNQPVFVAKWLATGNQRSWQVFLETTGSLVLQATTDGATGTTVSAASSVAISVTNTGTKWFRVSRNKVANRVRFYTSDDGNVWTQLGSDRTITASSFFAGSATLDIGSFAGDATRAIQGNVYRVKIYNSDLLTGTGTPIFDSDFAGQSVGATSFTEASTNAATVTVTSPARLVPRVAIPISMGGLRLPGISGVYANTPDSAALSITGDLDIRVFVAMDDWTPATLQSLIGKRSSTSNISYDLVMNTPGQLTFQWSADGTNLTSSVCNVTMPFVDGQPVWIRCTFDANDGAGNNVTKFYYSFSGLDWTQIGNTVTTAGVATIIDTTAPVEIGEISNLGRPFKGQFLRAQIRNNILNDGTGIVFDANFQKQALGSSTFTESSSNAATVTMQGGAQLASRFTTSAARALVGA